MKATLIISINLVIFIGLRYANVIFAFLFGYGTTSDVQMFGFVNKYLHYPSFCIHAIALCFFYHKTKNIAYVLSLLAMLVLFLLRIFDILPGSWAIL